MLLFSTPEPEPDMTRRAFNANPPVGIDRCSARIILRGQSVPQEQKETAQCMRRAVRNGMCAQHSRLARQGDKR